MRKLQVTLPHNSYPIYIGTDLYQQLPQLLKEQSITKSNKLMIITDDQVAPYYLSKITNELTRAHFSVCSAIVPSGEKAKNLREYEKLIQLAIEAGLDRSSVILALGGGVIGDLAGFVAASYMRGIRYVQLPTTLLAHDSSVGGKVGINHPLGKNMIGAFHQPVMVIYDVSTLSTLPQREICSGFAEVIKHGLIWDYSFVDWLMQHHEDLLSLKEPFITEAIARAIEVKVAVVSQDEREQGLRMILNYGHTIGHAIEGLTRGEIYTHGEAVGLGMIGAAWLSEQVYSTKGLFQRTQEIVTSFGLPMQLKTPLEIEGLLSFLRRDKKHVQGTDRWILSPELGRVEVFYHVTEEWVRQALQVIQP